MAVAKNSLALTVAGVGSSEKKKKYLGQVNMTCISSEN